MPPVTAPPLRKTPAKARIVGDRLILQDPALFEAETSPALRRLLNLAFSLPEIKSAVIRQTTGRVSFTLASNANPNQVWRHLAALLRQPRTPEPARERHAARLPLHPPASGLPTRISRFGQTLTTFQIRIQASRRIRISHPLLRDRDIKTRMRERLAEVHGVIAVRAARFRAGVHIVYDPHTITPEQLLRFLDNSWRSLLHGPPAPPPPRKLALTAALLAFSFTGQYVRLALLPWAAAAVLLYNFPNVIAAIADLRRRRIGLPAMYTLGFAFLLWFRLPFVSSLFSTFAQTWPALAESLAIRSENRLFAPHRRQQIWARLQDGTTEREIDIAALRPGMIITARKGDIIPADGIIVEGAALVDESRLTGSGFSDKIPGDAVQAGTYLADGSIAIRVTRAGNATAAAALAAALPRRPIANLPSLQKVEQIGNRNARPALLAASVLLLATRIPRYSQVIIRPDYLTAPRLSAHLSALGAIAESLAAGAFIRNPAALDRLLAADIIVLDDSFDFRSRRVQLSEILSRNREDTDNAARFAAAGLNHGADPRAAALKRDAKRRNLSTPAVNDLRRRAGAIHFRDETGSEISVLAPSLALGLYAPTALAAHLQAAAASPQTDPASRILAVARDRNIIGLVRFERTGPPEAADAVAALRRQLPGTRFVHLSAAAQETAEAHALELGLDAVFGDLSGQAKTEVMRSLSARAAWVGNATDPATATTRAAAAVTISTAGIDNLSHDRADILLLRGNLLALFAARLAAERRLGQLKSDYRAITLANLAAIAGGFIAGFGSLEAGLTSNLGTAAVFLSRWRDLQSK